MKELALLVKNSSVSSSSSFPMEARPSTSIHIQAFCRPAGSACRRTPRLMRLDIG